MHREKSHRRVSTIYLFCTRQACDYGTVLVRERGLSWPKHQRCPTLLFLLEYPLGLSLMSYGEAFTSAMRSPSAFTRRQKLWDTELIRQPKHFAWVTKTSLVSGFWAHAKKWNKPPALSFSLLPGNWDEAEWKRWSSPPLILPPNICA